jgi:hypothetical protein
VRIYRFAQVAFLFCAGPFQLHGQMGQGTCTSQHPMVVTCRSAGCFGQYDARPSPNGGVFDDEYIVDPCCGVPVQIYTGEGGCTDASLKSQVARDGLPALALNGVQLLVKDCDGHFGHFIVSTQSPIDVMDRTIELKNTDAIHLAQSRS